MASVSHNVRVSRPFLPTTGSSGDKYAKRLRGGAPFERRHCHSRTRKRPAIRVACNNNNNSNNNRNTIRASAVVRVLLFRSTPPPVATHPLSRRRPPRAISPATHRAPYALRTYAPTCFTRTRKTGLQAHGNVRAGPGRHDEQNG